jgi:hypothetical protein
MHEIPQNLNIPHNPSLFFFTKYKKSSGETSPPELSFFHAKMVGPVA